MGDTARFGGVRANFRVARRGAQALRWRTRSSSDNNGTRREAGDRPSPDSHALVEREGSASGVARRTIRDGLGRLRCRFGNGAPPLEQLPQRPVDVSGQCGKGRAVCLGTDPDHDVRRDVGREEPRPGELAQPALHTVPGYGGVTVARYDQPDPCSRAWQMRERGSDGPNLEERGSDTLPLLRDTLQFRASCNASASRKAQRRLRRVRLRRTCPGCGPSAASVLSSGGGQGSSDPIWFPFAHETRAS